MPEEQTQENTEAVPIDAVAGKPFTQAQADYLQGHIGRSSKFVLGKILKAMTQEASAPAPEA